jgi:hypothetical protein
MAAGYWMNETSGVLRPVVEAYLRGEKLTASQVATMRAYLRQWIVDPAWQGEVVEALRADLEDIVTREGIAEWLDRAEDAGLDPL